jgi:hypothetical protein
MEKTIQEFGERGNSWIGRFIGCEAEILMVSAGQPAGIFRFQNSKIINFSISLSILDL